MNAMENNEITQLPPKYRPLGAWQYFGYTILFGIPLLGFIALIILSFSNANINRRSFARSFFCIYLVVFIATAMMVVMTGGAILDVLRGIAQPRF